MVARVNDNRYGVEGDRYFEVLNPRFVACFDLGFENRSGCIVDVDLAAAEFFETAAGSRDADRYFDRSLHRLLESVGHGFGNQIGRTGAINGNGLCARVGL